MDSFADDCVHGPQAEDRPMRHIATAAILASALALPAAPAVAQTSGLVRSDSILIDYIEPRDPKYLHITPDDPGYTASYKKLLEEYQAYKAIEGRLQKRQLLEEFSQFLAPVRLPMPLRLRTKQCGVINAFYSTDDWSITLCYEYVKKIEDDAPKATTLEGITRRDAIVGRVVGTLLHEAGHAMSSLLQLPVLAREEDSADQIAAFVMLQFGTEVAKTMIKGQAYGWHEDERRYFNAYWDVHSIALQRLHTYLCIAYGKYPAEFNDFVRNGWLPKLRAPGCAAEYRQAERAFRQTILPHVDQDLMKQVLARKWLPPDNPNDPF
jgi:Putative metallopeptidase